MSALPREQERELLDLFNVSKVALADQPWSVRRWDRLIHAITEFCTRHPDVAAFRAYMALDQMTKHQPTGGDDNVSRHRS